MDLFTYIAASAIAVFALYLINRVLGGPGLAKIINPEMAVNALRRDYPGIVTTDVLLSLDGGAALVATNQAQKTGLVVTHGDKLVTRLLGPDHIQNAYGIETGEETSLRLMLADPTLPRAEIHIERKELDKRDDRQQNHIAFWLERLSHPATVKNEGELNHGPA